MIAEKVFHVEHFGDVEPSLDWLLLRMEKVENPVEYQEVVQNFQRYRSGVFHVEHSEAHLPALALFTILVPVNIRTYCPIRPSSLITCKL
jgi:hypothetical protein